MSLTNCNGGYTYDAPYGVQISGFAGNDGDVLTISVPTSMAGQQLSITFTGYDSRSTANYAWYAPSNNDQKVVMVGNGLELPAVTTRLTLIMPDSGGIEIYKTGDNGAALARSGIRRKGRKQPADRHNHYQLPGLRQHGRPRPRNVLCTGNQCT